MRRGLSIIPLDPNKREKYLFLFGEKTPENPLICQLQNSLICEPETWFEHNAVIFFSQFLIRLHPYVCYTMHAFELRERKKKTFRRLHFEFKVLTPRLSEKRLTP
jgi:hypothetical protein